METRKINYIRSLPTKKQLFKNIERGQNGLLYDLLKTDMNEQIFVKHDSKN